MDDYFPLDIFVLMKTDTFVHLMIICLCMVN